MFDSIISINDWYKYKVLLLDILTQSNYRCMYSSLVSKLISKLFLDSPPSVHFVLGWAPFWLASRWNWLRLEIVNATLNNAHFACFFDWFVWQLTGPFDLFFGWEITDGDFLTLFATGLGGKGALDFGQGGITIVGTAESVVTIFEGSFT